MILQSERLLWKYYQNECIYCPALSFTDTTFTNKRATSSASLSTVNTPHPYLANSTCLLLWQLKQSLQRPAKPFSKYLIILYDLSKNLPNKDPAVLLANTTQQLYDAYHEIAVNFNNLLRHAHDALWQKGDFDAMELLSLNQEALAARRDS